MGVKELYNSRILEVYCKLINARYPEVDLKHLAQECGIKLSQIYDQGHWFTQNQVNTFYNTAVAMTGNQQIAREAGRFAVSANALGVMRQYILSAFGPKRMFQIIGKLTSKLTRSSEYTCNALSENSVELIVKPYAGVKEEPFQCENRMGFFECGVMMFNYNLPGIRHTECVFRGDESCRYEIKWELPLSVRWRKFRNHCSFWGAFIFIAALLYNPFIALSIISPAILISLIALNFFADNSEKIELRESLMQTSDVTEKLVDQISITYNNAAAIKDIGAVLKHDSTRNSILQDVSYVLKSRLDFERCAILLANREQTQLSFCEGYGYTNEELDILSDVKFNLDNPDSQGILIRCFRENRPALVNNLSEYLPDMSARSRTIAYLLNVHSLVCSPICIDSKPVGVLMMDNPQSRRPLVETDLNLIEGVAPSIGTSLHNLNLLKEQEDQFDALLKVMSASIDARDSLTRGHSEKVTEYALDICRMMELDHDFCESVRVAALLHDYGKLAIPDAVLKKPGKLTDSEFEQIKTHAVRTGDILRQIKFSEALNNVPFIAEAHHEKLDGSGYPYGLKGQDIPLGSRIIAVADIFEALTAKRYYRESLPEEVALGIIRKDVKTHYDPDVFRALELSLARKTEIN